MSKEQRQQNIDNRSEEVQEILGHVPHWIIRSGIAVIFMVIIVLVIGSWFFKYPDIIQSSLTLTTENPPASIVSRTSGQIKQIFVKDNNLVKENEVLGLIDNPANFNDIGKLKEIISSYDSAGQISESFLNSNLSLGELQVPYSLFIKNYKDYNNFKSLNYHQQKRVAVTEQIDKVRLYYDRLNNQKQISEKELNLAYLQYKRDSVLHSGKVIADAEFEKSETIYLQKRYAFEGAKTTLANTEVQLSQLKQVVLDLELQSSEQESKLNLVVMESFENLKSKTVAWEQKYLLRSPIAGHISFTNIWSTNQNISENETVFTVVPEKKSLIIGRVDLPVQGSGKVKVGQDVNIKFLNYPYQEYGIVKGKVESISLVHANNQYTVKINLKNGLTSTYNRKLEYNPEMKGTAEIITEDLRLLERIMNPIRSALKKQ